MNWVQSIGQFPVFFWASSLSLGIHGLAFMMPIRTEPTKPPIPPLQTISLIPLSPNLQPPTSPIPVQPTPIASPSVSSRPNSPQPNLSISTSSENEKLILSTPKVTPTENPIDPNDTKQTPTKQTPASQEPTPSKKVDPVPEKPAIENPEQFVARTQAALTQVTGQLGQQYGDRFAERSTTIAVSPELFFTQPDLFYDKSGTPRSGLDKAFQIEKEVPDQVFKAFEINLQKAGFTVLPVEDYGGGLLYEIKSKKEGSPERVAFYLNLLLIPDRSGTIVVIWKQRPQK